MMAAAASESVRLRAKGWSIPGLARRYGVSQQAVAMALGEQLVGAW